MYAIYVNESGEAIAERQDDGGYIHFHGRYAHAANVEATSQEDAMRQWVAAGKPTASNLIYCDF